jgi:hypothetical protein
MVMKPVFDIFEVSNERLSMFILDGDFDVPPCQSGR